MSYTLSLRNGGKVIQQSQDSVLQITFGEAGALVLQANIQKAECVYSVEKHITTYQKSLVYLGEHEEAFQL